MQKHNIDNNKRYKLQNAKYEIEIIFSLFYFLSFLYFS